MSLGNLRLRPVPSDEGSGRVARIEKQYKGLKRIVRVFESEGGASNFPENVEEYVFDTFGLKDGQSDSPAPVSQPPAQVYANTYLEEQRAETRDRGASLFVTKVYQEAYDTVREIEKPKVSEDENGRTVIDRVFVILNTAPDANKKAAIGSQDADKSDHVLISQTIKEGNAVTLVSRRYLQATDELTQIGESSLQTSKNGLLVLGQQFVGTPAAPNGDSDVGVDTITIDGTTLYLAGINISENEAVKTVEKRWAEPGILRVNKRDINEGLKQLSYEFLAVEQSVPGIVIARNIGDFEGLRTVMVSLIQNSAGESPMGGGGDEKLNFAYDRLLSFNNPGVIEVVSNQGHTYPIVRSPVDFKVSAKILTYYQSSNEIVVGDFTKDGAIGMWNPADWARKVSQINAFRDPSSGRVVPAFFNAQGLRGVRTAETVTVGGFVEEELALVQANATAIPQKYELQETTEIENGKSIFRQVINYVHDSITEVILNVGTETFIGPRDVNGVFTMECKWTGTQWRFSYTNVITDTIPSDADDTNSFYWFSQRNSDDGWVRTYSNQSSSASNASLLTGTNGGISPWDATWAGIIVGDLDKTIEVEVSSPPRSTVFTDIKGGAAWIEGRALLNGATGSVVVTGGPTNPLGKRWVLDVQLKKAFEDVDGNAVFQKQIVVSTVQPAGGGS